jgi:hypothetical protein
LAKPNTGTLHENENWAKPGDPDSRGYVITVCPCCNEESYFWMSAWEKVRDGKPVQTLAVRPKLPEEHIRVRRPGLARQD